MKKFAVIAVVLSLLAMPAITKAATEAGRIEVGGLAALYSTTESGSDPFYQITAQGGYFLTDQLELSALFAIFGASGDSFGLVGGGVDYHYFLQEPDLIPFTGASLTIPIGDYDQDALLELRAGLKQFLGENFSMNYVLSYGIDTGETSEGLIRLQAGFSTYF